MNWMRIDRPNNWQHFLVRFIAVFIVSFLYFSFLGGQGVVIDVIGAMVAVFVSVFLVDKIWVRSE